MLFDDKGHVVITEELFSSLGYGNTIDLIKENINNSNNISELIETIKKSMKTEIIVPDEVNVTEFHRETHFVSRFDPYETEDTDTPATLVFDNTLDKIKFLQAELEKTKDVLEQKEALNNIILHDLIAKLDHDAYNVPTDENGRITPLKTSELLRIPDKTRDMDFPKDGISYVENLIRTNENLSKVVTGFEIFFCDKQKSIGDYYESGLFRLNFKNNEVVCALHKSEQPVKYVSRQELDEYISKTDLSYLKARFYKSQTLDKSFYEKSN